MEEVVLKKNQLSNEKPKFILVQIGRWDYDYISGQQSKNNDPVQVPQSFTVNDIFDGSSTVYDSVAVVHHLGQSNKAGHYISEVKMGSQWWTCNDDATSQTTFNKLINHGYMFLFKIR